MKKLLLTVAVILVWASTAFAVHNGTHSYTETVNRVGENVVVVTFTWLGDSGDGVIDGVVTSAAAIEQIEGLFLYQMITKPGVTAPTSLYDIAVNDADSVDLLGTAGVDRSATVAQRVYPLLATSTYGPAICKGALTVAITNNAVVSATGTISLYFIRGYFR